MYSKKSTVLCRLKKMIAAILLPVALFVVPVWAEGGFVDVASGYWGAPYIQTAVDEGLITGYAIGDTGTFSFKPENKVSKQESLAMIYRTISRAGLLKEPTDLSADYEAALSRCSIAEWARLYVSYAFKYAYIAEEDFSASTKTQKGGAVDASRQTIAAWSAKAMGYELAPVSILYYKDASSVGAAYIPYVDALYRNGIMRGDTLKEFHPLDGIKRSEFAAICTRLLTSARENGSDVQAARRFEDSFIIDSGTVSGINASERTLLLRSASGDEHRLQLSAEAAIVLDGADASFSDLASLADSYVSVSCLLGAGGQVLVQTGTQVLSGTVLQVSFEDDYAIATVRGEGGKVIKYCYNDDTAVENVIAIGKRITFIADGVYLLEVE